MSSIAPGPKYSVVSQAVKCLVLYVAHIATDDKTQCTCAIEKTESWNRWQRGSIARSVSDKMVREAFFEHLMSVPSGLNRHDIVRKIGVHCLLPTPQSLCHTRSEIRAYSPGVCARHCISIYLCDVIYSW